MPKSHLPYTSILFLLNPFRLVYYKMSLKGTMESSKKLNTLSPNPEQVPIIIDSQHQLISVRSPKEQEFDSLIQEDCNFNRTQTMLTKLNHHSASNISNISKADSSLPDPIKLPQLDKTGLENYLHIRIRTDFEKIEELTDDYPALELRKAMLRLKCAISELFKIIINSSLFQVVVIFIILLNIVVLALEDPKVTNQPHPYDDLELFFVYFYTVEFAMIVIANGFIVNSDSYFRDWWNILDFTILVTAWLSAFAGSGFRLSSLRSMRILRPLRSISSIKGMKTLVLALMNSIKPLLSALFILFFFIFVFAIAAVQLWMGQLRSRCMSLDSGIILNPDFVCGAENCNLGEVCIQSLDNPNYGVTHFDNIFISLVTVFQIITLEGWTSIMYITQTGFSYYSIFYYMPLIFIAGNLIINFTMAIIAISFKHISRSMLERQALSDKLEQLSDILFQRIYKNTMKCEVTKGSDFINIRKSLEETRKFLSEADENEEENEKLNKEEEAKDEIVKNCEEPYIEPKKIKFNKAIMRNVKSSVIVGDQYELDSFSSDFFFDEKFESNLVINVNSAFCKTDNRGTKPAFNKKSSENGISHILEPQLTYFNFLGSAKSETNQIVTDIQPDVEIQQKNKQDYDKLKSVITIKHKTLNFLEKNPERVKNTHLEIAEDFKIVSDSIKEVIPPSKKPLNFTLGFTYRHLDEKDPSIIEHYMKSLQIYNEYPEFLTRYQVFCYLSLKRCKKNAFFSLVPNSKLIIEEKLKDFYNVEGDWSGIEVDPSNLKEHLKFCQALSTLNLKFWADGSLGVIQKFLFPLKLVMTHKYTNYIMLLAVLINTSALAVDHYRISQSDSNILQSINLFFTYFFTCEMFLKLLALGPVQFFRDFMNIFDSIVVILSLVELFILTGGTAITAFRAIRIFRIFRVLRVVRIFRYLKSMTLIITSISKSLSSIFYLFLLLVLFQIIFTLLNMQVFGGTFNFPEGIPRGNFDDFHWAFISTFQLLSVENWNDILTSSLRSSIGPSSCLLLISWIILGNFILLNLFLAILLDSFNETDDDPVTSIKERRVTSKLQKKIEDLEKYIESESDNIDLAEIKGKSTQLDNLECEKSYFIYSKTNKIRVLCYKISHSPKFENALLALIIINSLKLVWDTYILDQSSGSTSSEISNILDTIFTSCFILEFLIKSIAFGFCLSSDSYLSDNWNKLDFIIVVMSVIDMSVTSIDIPVIKVFRVLRTLRPLKLIKHNSSMKVVVLALLESIVGIINVMIVILMVWIIFAILGVSLLSGKMHFCGNSIIDNIDDCQASGFEWKQENFNFDNVLQAMLTLFIVMSQESWPNRMLEGVDARAVGLAPVIDYNPSIAYFYVIYLILANFFLVNLFTVIVFDKFNEAKRNESNLSSLLLSKEQVLWSEIQTMILRAKPWPAKIKISSTFRQKFHNLSKNKTFDFVIMIFILINMISMAMAYQEASNEYNKALDIISLICTFVFISEAIIKIIGLGTHYFKSKWNRFDFIIALSSLVDIILTYSSSTNIPFLRRGPQLIRVLRVIRVTRLLRLVKSLQSLENLIKIMTYSLPALLNVLGLLLLIFFLYAVLGSFLFHSVNSGDTIDNYFNFSNFHSSMNILWRISTGEDYQSIMHDCVSKLDNYAYVLYFTTFVSIIDFLVLDLFITITLQYFEEFYMNPYNSLNLFNEDLKIFKMHWMAEITDSPLKVNKDALIRMIGNMAADFPFLKGNGKISTAKLVAAMNIEADPEGKFCFNDVLYAVLRRKYFKKINKRMYKIDFTIMRAEDIKTRRALKKLRENYNKASLLSSKKPGYDSRRASKLLQPIIKNTFYETFFLKSVFSNWKNYASNADEYNRQITPEFSDVEYPGDVSLEP